MTRTLPESQQARRRVVFSNRGSRLLKNLCPVVRQGERIRLSSIRMIERRPQVSGVALDAQTRCTHYNSPIDIIAVKMKCCGLYYACKDCHDVLAKHAIEVWPHNERDSTAVLCGACGIELTVRQYLDSSNECPGCGAQFNPGCRNHYHFYFEADWPLQYEE
jgi:uncharacterized CHY-type Zn-finger protein